MWKSGGAVTPLETIAGCVVATHFREDAYTSKNG